MLRCIAFTVRSPGPVLIRSLNVIVPAPPGRFTTWLFVPFGVTVTLVPAGVVTVKPPTEDWALHAGAEISQQLHCVELVTSLALMFHPPPRKTKPETCDDDWLVIPL